MKKSLLNESEIRKFMKFADLNTLTENFIENSYGLEEDTVTEDTFTEEVLAEEDVDVKDLVTALMDVIQDKTGVQVSVEDDPGAEADGELEEPLPGEEEEVGSEPSPEAAEDDLGDLEAGAPEEEEVPPEEETDMIAERLVHRITRRVAARLLKENRK